MNLIQLLFTGRNVRSEELATQIAERALAEVKRRLNSVVYSMSHAEARGYVRARAAKPIRQQMSAMLSSVPSLTPEQSQEILVRATERTVTQVVSDFAQVACEPKRRKAA
jgi:hypothetical protein